MLAAVIVIWAVYMDKRALEKAKSRLRIARSAVEDLSKLNDYDAFQDHWYVFLSASKNIYTVLEQGVKGSTKSQQWFELKKQERRNDPLLQYIYQARNDNEHGLQPVTEYVPGSLAIGVSKPGYSNSMRINGSIGSGGTLNVSSLDNKPVLIEQTLPHAKLMRVHDGNGKAYAAPEEHMGRKLSSNLPLPVAELTANYLEQLVAEAERLG